MEHNARQLEDGLPRVDAVPALAASARAELLDLLFEPSTPLHTLSLDLLHTRTFDSYDDLVSAVGLQLTELADSFSTSDTQWLDSILGAHPRLGAPKVDSAQSRAEQAQLRDGDGAGLAKKLQELNAEYEAKFPGLIYLVFVNGRSRAVIMEDMRRRIDRGDIAAERRDGIRAMCEIAADRARKLERNNA